MNSILIGIAIGQHLISGVDEKMSAFFPEYSDIFADSEKDKICLKHFLSMTALSWDEWTYPYTDARNDHVSMNRSNDPVRYALERPVAGAPGSKFVYNSGIAITMGQIIYKVSGLRADKFAERYLFAPLGISDYYWWKYPNGTVQTGGGLYLRPRDMAKIGQLFLNAGRWQGKQDDKWRTIPRSFTDLPFLPEACSLPFQIPTYIMGEVTRHASASHDRSYASLGALLSASRRPLWAGVARLRRG